MAKKVMEEGHPRIRRAVFILLALVLVVMMGRLVVEAFSFVSANAAARTADNKITGMAYTIEGGNCPDDANSADCCQEACSAWCKSKGQSLIKVGVVEPIEVKCKCTCLA
jgi:hypothetical protein